MLNGNVNDNNINDGLFNNSSNDPISNDINEGINNESNLTESGDANNKRLRTFSETLKMLDDDIIADLNVK